MGTATCPDGITSHVAFYRAEVSWMRAEGPTENMQSCDAVEIDVSGIGTLRSYVVSEGSDCHRSCLSLGAVGLRGMKSHLRGPGLDPTAERQQAHRRYDRL